jgi:hypothetical protein
VCIEKNKIREEGLERRRRRRREEVEYKSHITV